ncbi:MAG: hypothetical protein ABIP89_07695 [Polyangiaceae bacterium]
MRPPFRVLTFLALVAVCSSVTVAAEAAETPSEPTPRRWYGYQVLFADGGAIAGGIATGGILFAPGYLLGAPAVHAIQGRPLRAFVDLGLRLGLPLAGATVVGGTEYLATREKGLPLFTFGVLGAASGAIAAMTIDATVLAWEETPVRKESALSIAPSVRFFGKEKTVGLVGLW